jgi:hypothetical protein
MAPFVAYLTRQLGTKVTLRIANDYAAVIEGQRAGNIHIGYYGPASFSRAPLRWSRLRRHRWPRTPRSPRRARSPSPCRSRGR